MMFTVTRSSSPASLPAPQATVATIEFGFRGATTLRDGTLVRFKNNGYLIHMVQGAAQVASTATAAEAEADLRAGDTAAASKSAIAPLEMERTAVRGREAGVRLQRASGRLRASSAR